MNTQQIIECLTFDDGLPLRRSLDLFLHVLDVGQDLEVVEASYAIVTRIAEMDEANISDMQRWLQNSCDKKHRSYVAILFEIGRNFLSESDEAHRISFESVRALTEINPAHPFLETIWCARNFGKYGDDLSEVWETLICANRTSLAILANAASFELSFNPSTALRLFTMCAELEPANSDWIQRMNEARNLLSE